MDYDEFFSEWPSRESLSRAVSWCEVDRGGETYIEPEFAAEHITPNTAFTVGTVWFPDDSDRVALVRIQCDEITGVTVYDDNDIWVIRPSIKTLEWFQEDVDLMYSSIELDMHDVTRFPLRVATDLVNPLLRETMRIKILKGGLPVRWSDR